MTPTLKKEKGGVFNFFGVHVYHFVRSHQWPPQEAGGGVLSFFFLPNYESPSLLFFGCLFLKKNLKVFFFFFNLLFTSCVYVGNL